jgi:hypothetical protein
MLVDNLKQVSQEHVGAVDGAVPYICKHSKSSSLDDIMCGKLNEWMWESVSVSEAEFMDPIMLMFVKHVEFSHQNNNPALLKAFNIGPNKINNRYPVRASIVGILIDTTLYLKDKYKSEKLDLMKITTHEAIEINRLSYNINLNENYILGCFDLRSCTYYCKW